MSMERLVSMCYMMIGHDWELVTYVSRQSPFCIVRGHRCTLCGAFDIRFLRDVCDEFFHIDAVRIYTSDYYVPDGWFEITLSDKAIKNLIDVSEWKPTKVWLRTLMRVVPYALMVASAGVVIAGIIHAFAMAMAGG